ncbi:MAG TPA: hypothetical protein VH914_01205 [Acidimicrobiia bacterium]|jgi:hypothetical protein|nr:hypothetical protein [Acidimicrobiia bacterium]
MSSDAAKQAARSGWEIFIDSDPAPSREEINEALASLGSPGISTRMYRHYEALVRHGYGEYVPINQLDVTVKARLAQAN